MRNVSVKSCQNLTNALSISTGTHYGIKYSHNTAILREGETGDGKQLEEYIKQQQYSGEKGAERNRFLVICDFYIVWYTDSWTCQRRGN